MCTHKYNIYYIYLVWISVFNRLFYYYIFFQFILTILDSAGDFNPRNIIRVHMQQRMWTITNVNVIQLNGQSK